MLENYPLEVMSLGRVRGDSFVDIATQDFPKMLTPNMNIVITPSTGNKVHFHVFVCMKKYLKQSAELHIAGKHGFPALRIPCKEAFPLRKGRGAVA